MATIELDRTDIVLLAELQRDGRLTNAELAERVHLSASACLRRVQRLEREGVIRGYRAEVDAARLGLGLQAFVRVRLGRHDSEAVAAFAEFVGDWDEVVACYALTGGRGAARPGRRRPGFDRFRPGRSRFERA